MIIEFEKEMIDKSASFANKNGIATKENIPLEPLMDEEKGNVFGESFKEYAKSIFSDSLIPGFSQIVSTRTWKKKLWKSAIFSVCLAGFLYQAREFMAYYWTYPTTTYTKISWPSEVLLPAVTFCSNNR
nr:uncharacterized protein LOC122271454 [Parasteatoda tepidariorum]